MGTLGLNKQTRMATFSGILPTTDFYILSKKISNLVFSVVKNNLETSFKFAIIGIFHDVLVSKIKIAPKSLSSNITNP